MILVIWITPFLLAIFTTLIFNKRTSTTSIHDKYTLFSILDIAKTYTFMMIFLNLIVTNKLYFSFGFAILFMFIVLIHLGLNKDKHNDIEVVYETLKNNVVIQMTTFVLFLVFMYVYRDISNHYLAISLSIFSASIIFILTYWLQKLPEPILDRLQLKLELASRYDMLLFYFAGVIILVIGGIIFFQTTKSPINVQLEPSYMYNISSADQDNIFDWETITVLKSNIIKNDNNRVTYLLIKDSDNMEYLVILDSAGNNLLPEFSYFQLSTNNQEYFGNNARLIGVNNPVIISSSGLYSYTNNTITVVPGTEDKLTGYVNIDGETHYLVQEGNQSYVLLNSNFGIVDTISNLDLTIISDQLFIKSVSTYTNYLDQTLIYHIQDNSTPYFDVESTHFYQIKYLSDEAVITISKDDIEQSKTIPINQGDTIIPIFDGTLYNAFQFSFQDKSVRLEDNLVVYAMKNINDNYDTFIKYNQDDYFINYDNSTIITTIKNNMYDSKISYELSTYSFEDNEAALATNMQLIVIRYSIFIFVFLFVPITNYQKHLTIDGLFQRTK